MYFIASLIWSQVMGTADILFTIFGGIALYLLGSNVYFARHPDAPATADDRVEPPSQRGELLASVRDFMQRHDISEEWLLRHGMEKESLSATPGSIFGRTSRRQDFGHRLPFSPLEEASDQELLRILRRGSALIRYRDGVDCCHSSGSGKR